MSIERGTHEIETERSARSAVRSHNFLPGPAERFNPGASCTVICTDTDTSQPQGTAREISRRDGCGCGLCVSGFDIGVPGGFAAISSCDPCARWRSAIAAFLLSSAAVDVLWSSSSWRRILRCFDAISIPLRYKICSYRCNGVGVVDGFGAR